MIKFHQGAPLVLLTLTFHICTAGIKFPVTNKYTADTLGTPENVRSLIVADFELQGISTSNGEVPFWMRSNRFGSTPLSGISSSLIGRIEKQYSPSREKLFDWGAALEPRLNLGNSVKASLIDAHVKARLGIFQLKAGRSKDIMGLVDTTMSSGAFAVSGNALGIPKVELSVPEFWPILGGLLAFKGNFAFGKFGKIPVNRYNVPPVSSNFLQKSLYARLGKQNWRLNFYAGFNHQSTYGGEDQIYKDFNLSRVQAFIWAVTGKTWVANSGYRTKLGNQLGSVDLGLTYDLRTIRVFAYRQQFYDIGALAHLANIRDGLTGISLTNNRKTKSGWNKLVFEYFYSKNQAGELWSPFTPSGDESYYNNYLYSAGWSYKGMGIGNPLITPRHEARSNLRYKDEQYFVNNRVIALHSGIDIDIKNVNIKTKFSYSQNFGTYATSPIGSSLGGTRQKLPPPYFERVDQVSAYLEFNTRLNRFWQIGASSAFDIGRLLYDSFGMVVSLKRSFYIAKP